MDQVAYDFTERVAALWKCCEKSRRTPLDCPGEHVPDCAWTRKSQKKHFKFFIGRVDGVWYYGFRSCSAPFGPDSMTMEQMIAYPDLQHVRIHSISFFRRNWGTKQRLDVDVQRLMQLIAYLSNEPRLEFEADDSVESPVGSALLNCLSSMRFSTIYIGTTKVGNRLLENQFSQRKPTVFTIHSNCQDEPFFTEHTANGNIKRFIGIGCFRAQVMGRIIDGFLANPENYEEDNFSIDANFDESTAALLDRKIEEGEGEYDSVTYRFKAYNSKLQKHQCICVLDEGWDMWTMRLATC